jgi:hypothetical protein
MEGDWTTDSLIHCLYQHGGSVRVEGRISCIDRPNTVSPWVSREVLNSG